METEPRRDEEQNLILGETEPRGDENTPPPLKSSYWRYREHGRDEKKHPILVETEPRESEEKQPILVEIVNLEKMRRNTIL